MKQITNKTILKQGQNTFQPIEVDGVIYWYEDKQIPNVGYVKSICLGEIEANKTHGVKLGDKQYVSPFVNKVGECYGCRKIVAQSSLKLEGIPVISLDSYVQDKAYKHTENLILSSEGRTQRWWGFIEGYKSNPNQYTQKDIEKAIELAREYTLSEKYGDIVVDFDYFETQIIDQINFISVIEVDEFFCIKDYF
jgi:hypothetical protein